MRKKRECDGEWVVNRGELYLPSGRGRNAKNDHIYPLPILDHAGVKKRQRSCDKMERAPRGASPAPGYQAFSICLRREAEVPG